MHRQSDCVADIQCAVILLREVRFSGENQSAMRAMARQYGKDTLWRHGASSAHVSGVAVFVKPGHSAMQITPATARGAAAFSQLATQ